MWDLQHSFQSSANASSISAAGSFTISIATTIPSTTPSPVLAATTLQLPVAPKNGAAVTKKWLESGALPRAARSKALEHRGRTARRPAPNQMLHVLRWRHRPQNLHLHLHTPCVRAALHSICSHDWVQHNHFDLLHELFYFESPVDGRKGHASVLSDVQLPLAHNTANLSDHCHQLKSTEWSAVQEFWLCYDCHIQCFGCAWFACPLCSAEVDQMGHSRWPWSLKERISPSQPILNF